MGKQFTRHKHRVLTSLRDKGFLPSQEEKKKSGQKKEEKKKRKDENKQLQEKQAQAFGKTVAKMSRGSQS